MVSALASIAKDFGAGFDEVNRQLLGPRAKLLLLKEEETDGAPFLMLTTVLNGWHAKFSDHFGAITFSIADISQGLAVTMREVTHVVIIDSALPSINHLLHEVSDDTAAPSPDTPFWRLRASGTGRLYAPPVEQ